MMLRLAILLWLAVLPDAALAATPIATEEVRISSDTGVVLAGTLQKPHADAGRPVPVAIVVAGTGPWARGGFAAIRARLLEQGIATLEYDKRGQGRSSGAFVDTLDAMEHDLAAAVAFLRTRRDVDPGRIAIVGQSQGAVAAPIVASRDGRIAAVVMLSGPVGPRGELFLSILRANLAAAGKAPGAIDQASRAVSAWMDARSTRLAPAEIGRRRAATIGAFPALGFTPAQGEGAIAALDNDVVLSMFEAAPDRALAALRAPVLAIYGSRDTIIAPGLSASAAQAALGDRTDSLVVTVPGMTHELTGHLPLRPDVTAGDPTLPQVVDLVGYWLRRALRSEPPGH